MRRRWRPKSSAYYAHLSHLNQKQRLRYIPAWHMSVSRRRASGRPPGRTGGPSLIAQTIRDWPRRASPAANTPSTEVANAARLGIAAGVALDPELIEDDGLRREEAHRQEHEVRRACLLRARDRLERRDARVLRPVDLLDMTVAARELGGGDREVALAPLLQRVGDAELHRPARPGRHVVGPRRRRLADDLDLRDRRRASRGARSRRSRRRCRRRRSRRRACRPR